MSLVVPAMEADVHRPPAAHTTSFTMEAANTATQRRAAPHPIRESGAVARHPSTPLKGAAAASNRRATGEGGTQSA
jgi:hypothetical protein